MKNQRPKALSHAQREAILEKGRALLNQDGPIDEDLRDSQIRAILDSFKVVLTAESVEAVSRTLTNLGVAMGKGVIPQPFHEEIITTLFTWLEDSNNQLEQLWRSHIALRLGYIVYMRSVDLSFCGEIAKRLIAYAALATHEDEMLEHSVEALFMAAWESDALGIDYAYTICTAILDHIATKNLSITMLGRMLHAGATTLIQKRVPHGLGNEIVQQIIIALPRLREAKSAHYGLLAWALSDAAARDLAQTVPLDTIESLMEDEAIEEKYTKHMRENLALAKVMSMMADVSMNQQAENDRIQREQKEAEEILIKGLM